MGKEIIGRGGKGGREKEIIGGEKERINTFYATECYPCADNSRNVNAKSDDLDFGKKYIIFALLRSGLAANARLLRSFFAVYGPPKSLEGRLAGST